MFRAAKRRAEKNNIKVVFRLQFHVTQVPQPGWDKLFVSLIPVETGKITAKTGKAPVHNGSCEWADPVYETTRLVQEVKTGKCDEKLYNLVVSTGSSRLGPLGETTIDLTDYVGAITPLSVSLPLQNCNAGTVLHVMIQRLSAKPGFRDLDKKKDLVEAGHHTMSAEAIADDDPNESALISEETTDGHGSEVNECLENINYRFEEPTEGGNAIVSALALEIEPSDALEANYIHQKQLQSASVNIFTKQDERSEALQNFSDINEVLDDLEALKRKNSMMEDELKEMHDRYSQISLKFAEVEGEREQLVMTIKNLRNVKKT